MKKKAILIILFFIVINYVNAASLNQVKTGSETNRLNLIFIPSGYKSVESSNFLTDLNRNLYRLWGGGGITGVNWFIDNSEHFDVYIVEDAYDEDGVVKTSEEINNLINSLLPPYNNKFSSSSTSRNIHVIIHNQAGGQESQVGGYITLYRSSDDYYVFPHEFVHDPIGHLDDEYEGSEAFQINNCNYLSKRTLNIHDKATNEKWSSLIPYTSNAPYKGARYCGSSLWRPSESSIVRDSSFGGSSIKANDCLTAPCGFDPLGYQAMDLGLDKRLGLKSSSTPSVQVSGVSSGGVKSGSFTASASINPNAPGADPLRVEFYFAQAGSTSTSLKIDKTSPYSVWIDTTKYEDGEYYLDVVGYDDYNNYKRVTTVFDISNSDVLSVPISVRESLFLSDSGVDRVAEPVFFGIPLAKGEVFYPKVLRLTGGNVPSDYQIRTLGTWSDGSVKSVQMSFLLDVPAGDATQDITLTKGGALSLIGNSVLEVYANSANTLASDDGQYITINTGSGGAVFKVRKANFAGIYSVNIDGTEVVSDDEDGGVFIETQADVYTSNKDANSNTIVEENGPVKAVVKSKGELKNSAGERFMWYTTRLHFWKGKSYVRAEVTLRYANSDDIVMYSKDFRSAYFQSDLNLNGATKNYVFYTNEGDYSGSFVDDNPASLAVSYNDHFISGLAYDDNMLPLSSVINFHDLSYGGLAVKYGGNVYNGLSSSDDELSEYPDGYAQLYDSSGVGAVFGERLMSGFYPTGFSFKQDGSAKLLLYSDDCVFDPTEEDIQFHVGNHQTREFWIDYHTSQPSSQEIDSFSHRMDMPLYGYTDMEYLRTTKIFFGQDHFATDEELDDWADIHGTNIVKKYDQSKSIDVWRNNDWSSPGSGYDNVAITLTQFLRTPDQSTRRWNALWSMTRFIADVAVRNADDERYYEFYNALKNAGYSGSDSRYGYPDFMGWYEWDFEHTTFNGVPLYYLFTGDERIGQAVEECADYMASLDDFDANSRNVYVDDYAKEGSVSPRVIGGKTRTLAQAYWAVKDPIIKGELRDAITPTIEMMLENHVIDENSEDDNGWYPDRGYWFGNFDSVSGSRCVKGNFNTKFWPDGITTFYYVVKSELEDIDSNVVNARIDDLKDYLLGYSQWLANEWYVLNDDGTVNTYVESTCISATLPGSYNLNGNNEDIGDSSQDSKQILSLGTDSELQDWSLIAKAEINAAYPNNIDPTTMDTSSEDTMYDNMLDETGFLHMIYQRMTWRHLWKKLDVTSSNLGNDRWQLSWTVPSDCKEIKIKWYPGKQIVDWLGFDPVSRNYDYNPKYYHNYAFSYNYDNEPKPGDSGTTQNLIIDFSSYVNSYNSNRGLSSDDGGYVDFASDVQGETIYFDLRCFGGTISLSGNTTSTCNSGADKDSSNSVSIDELIAFIEDWKNGGVTINQIIIAIGEWKSGC